MPSMLTMPTVQDTHDTSPDKGAGEDRATGTITRSCRCGQQLDVCVRAHCPRCGRTLTR